VIELVDKVRLLRPLSLVSIKSNPELASWSFARHQQGAMRRRRDIKDEGVWQALRRVLVAANPELTRILQDSGAPEDSSASPEGRRQRKNRKQLIIFLSYASEDLSRVRRLNNRLKAEPQFETWFDKTGIGVGENWKDRIRAALESCDAVVICMSSHSFRKVSFLKTEIGWALKIANDRPEGTTFILPAKLEPCQVPRRLSKWQWVDLFEKGGHKELTDGLQEHLRRIVHPLSPDPT
jgi:hypothetical protein